jgi:hypothetical protein
MTSYNIERTFVFVKRFFYFIKIMVLTHAAVLTKPKSTQISLLGPEFSKTRKTIRIVIRVFPFGVLIPGANVDPCSSYPSYCEKACPFNVPIQGMLISAHDRLSLA